MTYFLNPVPAWGRVFICKKSKSINQYYITMNPQTTYATVMTTNRFVELKNNEIGLILVNTKKEEISIQYSDLIKIYIKKNKFNSSTKIGFVFLLLLLFSIASFTSHQEIALLQMMLSIPMIAKISHHKWYHLNLELQDGTLFSKPFCSNKKHYYINLVSRIKSDLYYHQIESNCKTKKHLKRETLEEDFDITKLSIA